MEEWSSILKTQSAGMLEHGGGLVAEDKAEAGVWYAKVEKFSRR